MAKEMKIPTVGESITEVVIANWLVEDGDHVEMDDLICELESDKATFEVPAEADGVIRLKAEAGDTLEIGALLCVIEEGEGGSTDKEEKTNTETKAEAKSEKKEESSQKTETFIMKIPTVGESISEVVLANWLVEDGEEVELDDPICELESDKANFEVPAEKAGKVFHIAEAGATLAIGDDFAKIEMGGNGSSSSSSSDSSGAENAPNSDMYSSKDSTYATGHASPAAAKILSEKGISPEEVKGTGRDGRITKEDAQNAKKSAPSQPKAPASSSKKDGKAPASAENTQQGSRSTNTERMSSLRKTIAKRLVAAKNQTAMLTTFNEVDMSAVMEMRKKYKDQFKEKNEVGLGFMSFFTKAVTMALMENPGINAQITGEKEDEILYHNYADVSIAVSSPRGLVVPVIRNAEQLSFAGVEKEVVRLAVKARDGKLTIDEMTGGTFTITNGGIFGSMLSTPIINAPQSAILGLHNIVQRPVAIDGKVEIRPIMYVALSYDHRIVDGKESVTFLYRIKELIEDPSRLLLGV
ncbi:2-oxoglutarate dehydrogenase complex dihydrolipoyllysine-residue succinyltransferase [Bernardetia sp. ABR2-2B]|uniref:2-oxoglutarate dehydrogenase complex dihydrolipoyllysine-residue succinyltransferase n=1 Tax=Bernardetia sp. ABR2-2B TaxID=3127472 RepID=UPI0030D4368E